jgi:hypothetical protein
VGEEVAAERDNLPALVRDQDDPEFEVRMQVRQAMERIEGGQAAQGPIWDRDDPETARLSGDGHYPAAAARAGITSGTQTSRDARSSLSFPESSSLTSAGKASAHGSQAFGADMVDIIFK